MCPTRTAWAGCTAPAANSGYPASPLTALGESDFADIVAKAASSSSMKDNPITLTEAELTAILAAAL